MLVDICTYLDTDVRTTAPNIGKRQAGNILLAICMAGAFLPSCLNVGTYLIHK